jgi:hypothetical protein
LPEFLVANSTRAKPDRFFFLHIKSWTQLIPSRSSASCLLNLLLSSSNLFLLANPISFQKQHFLQYGKSDLVAKGIKLMIRMERWFSARTLNARTVQSCLKDIKTEFPLFRKWKSCDSNQIMPIHCRSIHNDEITAVEPNKDASTP